MDNAGGQQGSTSASPPLGKTGMPPKEKTSNVESGAGQRYCASASPPMARDPCMMSPSAATPMPVTARTPPSRRTPGKAADGSDRVPVKQATKQGHVPRVAGTSISLETRRKIAEGLASPLSAVQQERQKEVNRVLKGTRPCDLPPLENVPFHVNIFDDDEEVPLSPASDITEWAKQRCSGLPDMD